RNFHKYKTAFSGGVSGCSVVPVMRWILAGNQNCERWFPIYNRCCAGPSFRNNRAVPAWRNTWCESTGGPHPTGRRRAGTQQKEESDKPESAGCISGKWCWSQGQPLCRKKRCLESDPASHLTIVEFRGA